MRPRPLLVTHMWCPARQSASVPARAGAPESQIAAITPSVRATSRRTPPPPFRQVHALCTDAVPLLTSLPLLRRGAQSVDQDEEGCHQGEKGREKAQRAPRMMGIAEVVRIKD